MMETLNHQVRRKLNITWNDPITDARVEDIINSAIPDLIHRLGITDPAFDFSVAGVENTLFLAYCIYEWNHCLHEFFINYASTIAGVRAIHEVKNYQSEVEESG